VISVSFRPTATRDIGAENHRCLGGQAHPLFAFPGPAGAIGTSSAHSSHSHSPTVRFWQVAKALDIENRHAMLFEVNNLIVA
jgi:hypothetical protein